MRPWKRTSKGPVLWRDAVALERRRAVDVVKQPTAHWNVSAKIGRSTSTSVPRRRHRRIALAIICAKGACSQRSASCSNWRNPMRAWLLNWKKN
eukprot:symbB.v1.2.040651.t1/scaffold7409.1/size11441/2